jgi:glutamyl-tRNA synthetase
MRGRFAPSPTGPLHLGNLRTALLAWLFARSAGSTFSLRFEDLDEATVRAEHYETQRRDLDRLGVSWDDELRQSEHLDRYRDALATLARKDLTYDCYCSRREIREAASAPHDLTPQSNAPDGVYPGTCRELTTGQRNDRVAAGRPAAVRLRADVAQITFDDAVHGTTTTLVDDVVLARRDGVPAYNLVVVVDDEHQGVKQVVRADDLLLSTGRHIHLARLLEVTEAQYAHVPLVLGPGGNRLAKRDGAVTLADRLALGESVEGLRTRLARSAGLQVRDAHSADDLIDLFDPRDLHTGPWQFDPTDLDGV